MTEATGRDVLKESVKVSGGVVSSSVKIFKDSITNKTTWALTALIIAGEVGCLSYQRYCKRSIDDETFKRRVKATFTSNTAGVLGSSFGAMIGSLIGNCIAPGIGGYVGSLICGITASIGSSVLTDYYMDSQSYSLEKFENLEVSDKEKKNSYIVCCHLLGVAPDAKQSRIKEKTMTLYKEYHPDKNIDQSSDAQEFYKQKFIEVRLSYEFIKQYRTE